MALVIPSAGPPAPRIQWEVGLSFLCWRAPRSGGDRHRVSEEGQATCVSARLHPKRRVLAAARRPPPPPPLTSSAWPSSRSKVTTHTHSSQAEKRAQGVTGARAPEDGASRRSRSGRGPAPDCASIAETAAAGSALPGERPGGVAGGTAGRRRPRRTSGPRCGAVERPSRTREALPWSRRPLAAGGAQCSGEALSSPARWALAGQSGPERGGGTSGGARCDPRRLPGGFNNLVSSFLNSRSSRHKGRRLRVFSASAPWGHP